MNIGLGIAAAVAASACYNGGLVIQAREAREEPLESGLRASLLTSLARRRRWALGTAVTIAGWPLQTAALLLVVTGSTWLARSPAVRELVETVPPAGARSQE